MSVPLDRERLERAFVLLDVELARRGARARLLLAGGAVMALLYDADRVTRDADGVITEGHGPLTEAARVVAAELGLPAGWLNEGVSVYLSTVPDDTVAVFDGDHLAVQAVSIGHMIALKVRRAWPQDIADLRVLTERAGLTGVDGILRLVDRYFPDDPISARAAAAITDAFH